MTNNQLKTIYRLEGLLEFVGGEYRDSDEVYFFYEQEDAKKSLRISWSKVTPVVFVPLTTRTGLNATGSIDGVSRLLGRIIPVEIGAVILNAPTHL